MFLLAFGFYIISCTSRWIKTKSNHFSDRKAFISDYSKSLTLIKTALEERRLYSSCIHDFYFHFILFDSLYTHKLMLVFVFKINILNSVFTESCFWLWKRFEWSKSLLRFPPPNKTVPPAKFQILPPSQWIPPLFNAIWKTLNS